MNFPKEEGRNNIKLIIDNNNNSINNNIIFFRTSNLIYYLNIPEKYIDFTKIGKIQKKVDKIQEKFYPDLISIYNKIVK